MRNFFPDPGFAVDLRFSLFFNDLPPVSWIEKAGSPFERLPVPAMQCCMGEKVLGKKKNTCSWQMFPWVKWIPAFGYSFKHDHYSMGKFPCKSHCCASLYFLHANLVPMGNNRIFVEKWILRRYNYEKYQK